MRAVTLDAFDAAPTVRDDLPDPTAAAGGLVVRVRASSLSDTNHTRSEATGEDEVACASIYECTLSRVSEEAARAASSALAIVDTAERLLDRDLETSDDAGVAASCE